MKSKYQVYWSPKAKESYIEALLFILEKWIWNYVPRFAIKIYVNVPFPNKHRWFIVSLKNR